MFLRSSTDPCSLLLLFFSSLTIGRPACASALSRASFSLRGSSSSSSSSLEALSLRHERISKSSAARPAACAGGDSGSADGFVDGTASVVDVDASSIFCCCSPSSPPSASSPRNAAHRVHLSASSAAQMGL